MSGTTTFQRARKPEERTVRREAILAAAAALFDAEGPTGTTLNEIAARAGFTKSNVYRYFESREQVLLALMLDAFEHFNPKLEAGILACDEGDVAAIARVSAAAFSNEPRLAHLLAILSTVLEQNVSAETIVDMKRRMLTYLGAAGMALHKRMPGTTIEDCMWVVAMVGSILAGLWPQSHPSAVAAAVLTRPEFAMMKPKLPGDLERALKALLVSIVPAR